MKKLEVLSPTYNLATSEDEKVKISIFSDRDSIFVVTGGSMHRKV